MPVQPSLAFSLSDAAQRARSSAIRDLLRVVERPGLISLAGGLPAPETFPTTALADACASVLTDDPDVLQYSTTEGFTPLREWVADRHQVGVDRVLITHGSQQALDLTARALVDPGAPVALADPAYIGAIQVFRLAGARLLPVPSDGDGLEVDALADRLAGGERPALVYVVANFDNPTGATLSLERRTALAALADRYGFVIVEDDPYGELRWDGPPVPSLASLSDRVVALGTISKIVCPGLRIGYAIAPAALAPALVLVKQALDLHTSSLSQRMLHRVVTQPGFLDAQLASLRPLYRERAAALVGALRDEFGDRFTFQAPDGGLFVWGTFAGGAEGGGDGGTGDIDTERLLPTAVEAGVAYVPGNAFAVERDLRRSLRLSFATVPPDQLREGVRRLAAVVREPAGAAR